MPTEGIGSPGHKCVHVVHCKMTISSGRPGHRYLLSCLVEPQFLEQAAVYCGGSGRCTAAQFVRPSLRRERSLRSASFGALHSLTHATTNSVEWILEHSDVVLLHVSISIWHDECEEKEEKGRGVALPECSVDVQCVSINSLLRHMSSTLVCTGQLISLIWVC